MAGLTPHPRLVLLQERFSSETAAVRLSGYVAPSASGSIRLSPSPSSLREYVEIPEDAVLHSEQQSESDIAELFIDPSAVISAVSVRRFPLEAALRLRDQPPGDDTTLSCVEQYIEECKRDPMVRDPNFCDSDEARNLYKILCDILGRPKDVILA